MDPNCNSDKYMTIKEAAKKWKIPRRAVRLLIARGYLNNDGEAQTEKGKETEPANKDDKTEIKKGKKIINANQEKPTEQELFKIGYDYPKHCFVFFTFVRRYFRNNKIKVLWVIALLSIAFLLLLHDLLFQSEIYSLYTLSLNVLLIVPSCHGRDGIGASFLRWRIGNGSGAGFSCFREKTVAFRGNIG